MKLSLKPADRDHLYGHDKVAFFSAGLEGLLISLTAIYIAYEAIWQMVHLRPLEQLEAGSILILLATLINGLLGFYLIRKGKKYGSLILVANGKHILVDCWTSFGVFVSLLLVALTGQPLCDPIISLLIAGNILWTGFHLISESVNGLMDEINPADYDLIQRLVQEETSAKSLFFHRLRCRNTGKKRFIEFHLTFPKGTLIEEAHDVASQIEAQIQSRLNSPADFSIHLEALEDHQETHSKYGIENN
jgi:cation diffusion facilitator family transporter